jgi:hypothetical protein
MSPHAAVFAHDGEAWALFDIERRVLQRTSPILKWRPSMPESNSLRSIPVSWRRCDRNHVEIAGLGGHGTLHWASLRMTDGGCDLTATNAAADDAGYLAAAIVRPRLVAAVTPSRVDWLRCSAHKFSALGCTRLTFPSAIACMPNHHAGELIVIGADGLIARIPYPSGV